MKGYLALLKWRSIFSFLENTNIYFEIFQINQALIINDNLVQIWIFNATIEKKFFYSCKNIDV